MAERWTLAFAASAVVALAGAAALRRVARLPGTDSRVVRRTGGVVLVAAVVGWAFAPTFPRALLGAGLGVAAVTVIGYLADRQLLNGRSVFAALIAASVLPAAFGVEAEVTGVPVTDAVLTVLGIACVTAAVAGLGNTDGLLGGVVATGGVGLFALAAFGDQDVLATASIALVGACVGFLAYNVRPASLFVGQVGALPAGLLLAVFAIEVRPSIATPESYLVPLIVLALPILDGAIVALGRLRNRRQLTARRPDHLPHRLAAMGWPTGTVVAVLVSVQLALSVLGVFVGRGVLDGAIGAGIAAVLLLALAFIGSHGRVYAGHADGPSARVALVFLGLGIAAIAASVPAVFAGIAARDALNDGEDAARRGVSAARRGEPDVAAAEFDEAAAFFDDARDTLGGPIVSAGLAIPVLGSNLHAAQELSDAGLDLARAGERLTAPVDPEALRVRNGTISLEEVRRITPSLQEAADLLSRTEERVADLDSGFLVEPVRDAIDKVEDELADTQRDAVRGAAAARIAPAILGGEGPRRYFLAVQNPAELRGTGGFIGNWGILTANNGKVDLEFIERVDALNAGNRDARSITGPEEYLRRYERFEPAQTWQNVNMAPDFEVVGEVISELYPQSGGEQIDGVLFVDPQGLAALLRLTGPIRVDGWPDPINAENVVDVTLRQAYEAFARDPLRADFLGDVARRAVDVATEGDLGRPARIADVLGTASRQGHLTLWFTRPEEQAVADILNASGEIDRTDRDSLFVVNQNAAANKIDYYLRREIGYSVTIEPAPSGEIARVQGQVGVRLENTAPDNGLPVSVIGPSEGLEDRFVAGENFTYLSVYTPANVTGVALDGEPAFVEEETELGRNVFSAFLSVLSHQAVTLSLDIDGVVELADDHWYTLELVRQPFVVPDQIDLDLAVAPGWRIAETDGLEAAGDRRARGHVDLEETTTVRIRLEPTGGWDLWDRLHRGG